MIFIPSSLIAAYDPPSLGSLIGDKSNSMVFDNSKIKRFVSEYSCEVTWTEGVRRSLAWFEAHPEFQTIDHEMNASWDEIVSAYQRAFPAQT